MNRDVYIANETFACDMDGAPVIVHKGVTRVRSGHPLFERYKAHFDLVSTDVHFEIEEASAPPMRDGQSPRVRETAKAKQVDTAPEEALPVARTRTKA